MENRCGSCKYWDSDGWGSSDYSDYGACDQIILSIKMDDRIVDCLRDNDLIHLESHKPRSDGLHFQNTYLVTGKYFGCIHWEKGR